MSPTHSRVVFLLLILILLVVSTVLSLFTWWLGHQAPSQSRGAASDLRPAGDLAASASPTVERMERWTG